jgi:hypothetical protein
MIGKIALVSMALLLWPAMEASAAQKQAKPAVNCQQQARANCPNYGMTAQACIRAAIARCKQGQK